MSVLLVQPDTADIVPQIRHAVKIPPVQVGVPAQQPGRIHKMFRRYGYAKKPVGFSESVRGRIPGFFQDLLHLG